MKTRSLIVCALMLALTLTGCAYTTTSEADQQSVGFDSAAHLANCALGEACDAQGPGECTLSQKQQCEAAKKECSYSKAACDKAAAECEAARSKCTGESATDV